ncbi:MAG: YitT family protein [Marinilabiliales bacterium]|nr:YitT family protein [Marinilabiliales bacterium]
MQYDKAYQLLMEALTAGLPSHLTYHKADHTKQVIEASIRIARAEKVEGDDLTLLCTAALYHDAGYLVQSEGHEAISCEMARKQLPELGYDAEQTERVCSIILATRIPHQTADPLGKILCDADLYYLGTDQYDLYAENLYQELTHLGNLLSRQEWLVKQIEFLNQHRYFTETAMRERDPQKQRNLQRLQKSASGSFRQAQKSGWKELAQDGLLMVAGATLAGYALKCFLVPNLFFDGGVTGISLLVHELYHFNLAVVVLMLNLPFIIVSHFSVGFRFALRTLISVLLLGIVLLLLPDVAITSDKLLISIFGGVFLGIGIGLTMRAGAALDGIEVLALYTLKRTSFTITEIILGINVLIFSVAAFKFGMETALYSVLTYFSATRCIDYVVEGLQAFTGVTIISGKSEVIKYQLVNNLGRGITVYKGQRGFLPGQFEVSADCDIIFTVITRLELRKLKNLVFQVDPKAFVFASTIKEASGGILKRKSHH